MEKQSGHSKSRNCKLCGKSFSIYQDDYRDYCKKCVGKVQLQEKIEAVIPKRYREARLRDFKEPLQTTMRNLNGGGLFLWGDVGVGKTHAMAALAYKYIQQGFDVKRVIFSDVILEIRDTFKQPTVRHKTDSGGYYTDYGEDEPPQSERDVLEPLLKADKLFIEDIGTDKSIGNYESDFVVKTLEHLLDKRLENCLPTFITTNKSPEEIAIAFDVRVKSRIIGGCKIVKLTGKDRREDYQNKDEDD